MAADFAHKNHAPAATLWPAEEIVNQQVDEGCGCACTCGTYVKKQRVLGYQISGNRKEEEDMIEVDAHSIGKRRRS